MSKTMLFIPMYNCEKQIPRVLSSLTPEIQRLFSEVVVIDNGSEDNSIEAATQSLSKLDEIKTTLIKNDENISLGGSHKVAFNLCLERDYEHLVVLHGDDQGHIEDLVQHLRTGEAYKYDCFLGSRFAKGSKRPGYHWFRTFGNFVFNWLTTLITGRKVLDLGSGLNMYSAGYLKNQFYMNFPNDLTFNTFMLLHAIYNKNTLRFFALIWSEDDQVSNAKVFRQAWFSFKKILLSRFNKRIILQAKPTSKASYTYKVLAQS